MSGTTQGSSVEVCILVGGCHQNPWATSVIQHGHIRSRSLLSPSRTGDSSLLMTYLFADWAWTRGVLLVLWGSMAQLTYIWNILPCWFNSGGWLNFLGLLRLSWGCNAWLTAIAISLQLDHGLACFHIGFSLPPQQSLFSIPQRPTVGVVELGFVGLID